ncbi:Athe_2463 domain-containing protein [Caldicellulosiruptor sp. DIB 104C]|uniref:Athe_2463 domain-containing protein n=1 Tax=Caldicellulosiruptor sp. DIB 104C TaxID=3019889 RepID=UPI003BB90EDE
MELQRRPNGYFHKNRDGTGPRGWFRYAGYTMNGDLYTDKRFPNDSDGTQPVEYANVLTWSEISQLDSFTKSKLAVAGYDPIKVKSYQWDAIWKSRYELKDLDSGQSLGELFSQFSSYTSPPDAFKQRAVFKGVDGL